ncbi:hypothetical protein [Rhodosalinus sp. 5P4]|uniref:hypothetical protein n=1 Tax=Rhodosalinus sp. 5P4 TaxID=3239196 RepID=UPI003526A01B
MMEHDETITGQRAPRRTPDDIERDLTQASDEELRLVIKVASNQLTLRDAERKREAMAKIRMLAKEHGLNVAIDRPPRKRGRPAKKE